MKLTIIVLLLSHLFIGCGSSAESTPPPTSSDVLIPLAAGNKWIYETTYYDSAGVPLSPTYIDSAFVGLSTNFNGKLWSFYNHKGTKLPDDALLFRNDNRGTLQFDENFNAEFVKFPYPSPIGTFTTFSEASLHVQVSVLSINESVTTPKGIFTCYHYQPKTIFFDDNFNAPVEDFYIAPNIGIVKEVESNIDFTTEQNPDPIFGVTKVRILKDYVLE